MADSILVHGAMFAFRGQGVAVQTANPGFHEMAAAGTMAMGYYKAKKRCPHNVHVLELDATGFENCIVLTKGTAGRCENGCWR